MRRQAYVDSEIPDQSVRSQSDQNLRSQLVESFNNVMKSISCIAQADCVASFAGPGCSKRR